MNNSIFNAWKNKSIPSTPASKPVLNSIYLLTVPIAGLFYTDDINNLIDDLSVDDQLILEREPDNEHDKYAILVNDSYGEKLGYIPRENNKIIARLMDAGKNIYGKVKEIKDEDKYDRVMIDVFMED